MGHLINPIAMRLGRFSYWEDFWFIDFVYYPEFLHLVLKIKTFCQFFFSSKFMEIGGFLYSHFYVLKFFKMILIRIFFFNGVIDELMETYFLNSWQYFYENEWFLEKRDKLKGELKFYVTPSFINIFRLFVMLKYIAKFSLKCLSRNFTVKKFLFCFRKFDFVAIRKEMLKLFNVPSLLKFERFRFFLIFFALLALLKGKRKSKSTYISHNVEVEYTFIKQLFADKVFGCMFVYVNKFLYSILINFIAFFRFNFRFDFFILGNQDINAKFLSRYIGRKLQQGYNLKYAMNPIKKELSRLISVLRLTNPVRKKYFTMFRSKNFNLVKGFCIKLFNFVLCFIKLEFYKFYFFCHCWFRLDLFVYYYYMRNFLFKIESLIGLSIFSSIFFLFFDYSYLNFMRNLFFKNFFDYKVVLNFSCISELSFCFKILFSYINNFEAMFYGYCFLNFIDKRNVLLLKSSFFFFNSYLKYNYCLLQKYIFMGIVKEKSRNMKNFIGFSGFRLKFKGRFSRRQKASSVLYNYGSVPLTTLKTNIDYSFYTIPLKNSAISVKIWLHRNWYFDEIDYFAYKYDGLF